MKERRSRPRAGPLLRFYYRNKYRLFSREKRPHDGRRGLIMRRNRRRRTAVCPAENDVHQPNIGRILRIHTAFELLGNECRVVVIDGAANCMV